MKQEIGEFRDILFSEVTQLKVGLDEIRLVPWQLKTIHSKMGGWLQRGLFCFV